MVNKCFVLNYKVKDIFNKKYFIPTIENCHFILLVSGFLVQRNVGGIEMIVSTVIHQIYIQSLKDIVQKIQQITLWKYRVNIWVEIDNYQWKVLLLNILQAHLILVTTK